MTNSETINEYWDSEFTSADKQFFQKCARVLLKKTFIVRDKDDENRKMFYFVSKEAEFFSEYFSFIGFDVIVQKDSGVVMLKNAAGENSSVISTGNRYRLKKAESIVLCCLWTLFSDKIHRGLLDKLIKVNLSDLNLELEKYELKKFDKTSLCEILKVFCRFNLIEICGEIGSEDFVIILYPSLQFALSESDFVNFVKDAEKKMKGIDEEISEPAEMSYFEENSEICDSEAKTGE